MHFENSPISGFLSKLGPCWLLCLSCVVGICSTGIEIATTRLLTPIFGSSLYVWASLIIVVMLSVTLGYYLGGYLVDKFRKANQIYIMVLLLGGYLMFLPYWAPFYVHAFMPWVTIASLNIFFIAMVVAFTLVGFPFVVLSMVTPYIIEVASGDNKNLGRGIGRLAALVALGGILGKFLAVFWTIPFHGTKWTFFFFGLVLVVTAILGCFITALNKHAN